MESAGQVRLKTDHRCLRSRLCAVALAFTCVASAGDEWRLARSAHFEVYSQSGDASARALAQWLEQLHALLPTDDDRGRVRVIEFRSVAEYDPYRVQPESDAYYVGSESRDYIVMAGPGTAKLGVAAHEYAHVVLRSAGAGLPLWLREGLAEVLSTVKIGPRGASIGGDRPDRLATLRRERGIPLAELLSLTKDDHLDSRGAVFYAESWQLADMLLLSQEYAPRFPQFSKALAGGASSQDAFSRVYGKTLGAVEFDLRQRRSRMRRPLDGAAPEAIAIESSAVPPLRVRLLIGEVVFLAGDLDRAETLYHDMEREAPDDAEVALGLGSIALRRGDTTLARMEWKKAMDQGASDAVLCYRYAALAGMAGIPADDIRPALQRAIELKPDFDDARYSLALLESNAGRHQIAVAQLRAMRQVTPTRAYGYWTALADSLTQIGERAEAKAAAFRAFGYASNDEERRHAAALAHVAETDLAVRMTRDGMVTTRIPHGSADFNPFVEPGDTMDRIEGTLREVDCAEAALRIAVETAGGTVRLAIRGLDRIQIRNGAGELTCGPQAGPRVAVDFARTKDAPGGVAGDVRAIEFK